MGAMGGADAVQAPRPLPAGHTKRAVLRVAARKAAAGASSEWEFFTRLEAAGVLVRPRLSERTPGAVTGYAVSLPGHVDAEGFQFWYGGGRLAADLTLPRLRRMWAGERPGTDTPRLTPEERTAIWVHAEDIARSAAEQIRNWARTDPAAAADAAWAASDALHVAAKTVGSRELQAAADAYDRAARQPFGRIPRPSATGSRLRSAARLLALAGSVDRHTLSSIKLVANLGTLATAVGDLRQVQRRAAQAASARAAAEWLFAASPAVKTAAGVQGVRLPGSAADLARDDFAGGLEPPRPGARPGPVAPNPLAGRGPDDQPRRPRRSGR